MREKRSKSAVALSRRLKAAEQEVAILTRQLNHTQRLASMGGLCAMVAHEFNNILTPLLPYAHLATASPRDEALGLEFAQRTVDAVHRAAGITEAILGFTRPESDGDAAAAVVPCIEATLRCLPAEYIERRSAICIDACADLHMRIEPVVLQQVLLNLILNACEAVEPHQGMITISAGRSTWNATKRDPQPEGITLIVQDNGRGIPPGEVRRLFEPFFSHRGADSPRGCGLGLPLCKRLIEAAKGSIEIESSLGLGTAVRLWLPAAQVGDVVTPIPYKTQSSRAAA